MSKLRLKTGREFNASHVLILSLFISVTGLCSIVLSVIGFVKRIHGANVAEGLWCGSVMFVAGIIGIIASQIRRNRSVKVLIISMLIAIIFSVILLILSVGQITVKNMQHDYETFAPDASESDVRIIYITATVMASIEMLLCLLCILLCFTRDKKPIDNIKPPSPPINRRNILHHDRYKTSNSDISSVSQPRDNRGRYTSPRRTAHPYSHDDDIEQREFLSSHRDYRIDQPRETMTFLPEDSVRQSSGRRYRSRNARNRDPPVHNSHPYYRRNTTPTPDRLDDDVFIDATDVNDSDYSTLVRLANKQRLESEYRNMDNQTDTKALIERKQPAETSPVINGEEDLPPYAEPCNINPSEALDLPNFTGDDFRHRSDRTADREVVTILIDHSSHEQTTPPVDVRVEHDFVPDVRVPDNLLTTVTYDSTSMSLPMFLKREKHAQNVIANHPVNRLELNAVTSSATNFIIPKTFQNNESNQENFTRVPYLSDRTPDSLKKYIDSANRHDTKQSPRRLTNFKRFDKDRMSERLPMSVDKIESRRLMKPRYASFRTNRPNFVNQFQLLAPDVLNTSDTDIDPITDQYQRQDTLPRETFPKPPTFFYPPERLPSNFGVTTSRSPAPYPGMPSYSGIKNISDNLTNKETYSYVQTDRAAEEDQAITRAMEENDVFRISPELKRLLSTPDPPPPNTELFFGSSYERTQQSDPVSKCSDDIRYMKYLDRHRENTRLSYMLKQPPNSRVPRRSYPAATRRVMRLEQNAQEEPLYRSGVAGVRSQSTSDYRDYRTMPITVGYPRGLPAHHRSMYRTYPTSPNRQSVFTDIL